MKDKKHLKEYEITSMVKYWIFESWRVRLFISVGVFIMVVIDLIFRIYFIGFYLMLLLFLLIDILEALNNRNGNYLAWIRKKNKRGVAS